MSGLVNRSLLGICRMYLLLRTSVNNSRDDQVECPPYFCRETSISLFVSIFVLPRCSLAIAHARSLELFFFHSAVGQSG